MYLWFDFFPSPVVAHVLRVDLRIEMADVTDDGIGSDRLQHISVTYIDITSAGDNQIRHLEQPPVDIFQSTGIDAVNIRRHDLVTIHAGLHRANGVNFHHPYDHALLPQALGGTLAHIAVSNDQCPLSSQQHVRATLDGIVKTVSAAVSIIVL